jgi:hypothetical protein
MKSEVGYLDLDVYGSQTGTHYQDQVEMKLYLTVAERLVATKAAERKCAGLEKDNPMSFLVQTVCILDAHIVKKPAWWTEDGMSLIDTDPVYELAKLLREKQQEVAEQKSGGKVKKDAPASEPA